MGVLGLPDSSLPELLEGATTAVIGVMQARGPHHRWSTDEARECMGFLAEALDGLERASEAAAPDSPGLSAQQAGALARAARNVLVLCGRMQGLIAAGREPGMAELCKAKAHAETLASMV